MLKHNYMKNYFNEKHTYICYNTTKKPHRIQKLLSSPCYDECNNSFFKDNHFCTSSQLQTRMCHLSLTQEHVDVRSKSRIQPRLVIVIVNRTNTVYFHWMRGIFLPLGFWQKRDVHLNERQLRIVVLSTNHKKAFGKENKP